MGNEDVINLNNVEGIPNKIKAVIGVGTGIGLSMVIPLEVNGEFIYKVWPCEGGHAGVPLVKKEQ